MFAQHTLICTHAGFTQSLNLSVASAVVCCALDAHRFFDHHTDGNVCTFAFSRAHTDCPPKGGMGQGLSAADKRRVLLTWLALSMNRSGARLRRHGFSISSETLA